jgi:N-acetylglucosaminyldiphosphoundecaprenol N-acetyl-beta-D-mannosaminyltransferase
MTALPPKMSITAPEFACPPRLKSRRTLFGIELDPLTMVEAVEQTVAWAQTPDAPCRFVVTPNVDHIVQLQDNAGLQGAYRRAWLVLADGWPVVTAARWLGKCLPGRVPGSDLVPAIFQAFSDRATELGAGQPAVRVFLLGAAPGVADLAATRIEARWPGVQVVGTDSPPLGFEHSELENERILAKIAAAGPQILVVGLGAPKQELWVARHQSRLATPLALCVGATIDFLAGKKKRAPGWMQAMRLEWLHRLVSEPGRLAKRYWHDACVFPGIVWRELRQNGRRPGELAHRS